MRRRQTLYDKVGVSEKATPCEIKAAYRRKSKELHPDHGGDAKAFADLSKAVAVLTDPSARARYDATGEEEHVDRTESEALSLLISLLQSIVLEEAIPIETIDICQYITAQLDDGERVAKHEVRKLEQRRKRLQRVMGRIKRRAAGPNLLEATLRDSLRKIEGAIVSAQDRLRIFGRAREHAAEYDFGAPKI